MAFGEVFDQISGIPMILFHSILILFAIFLLLQTKGLETRFTGLIRIRAPVDYSKFRWAFFAFIFANLVYIMHYLDFFARNLSHILGQLFFFLTLILMYLGIKTR